MLQSAAEHKKGLGKHCYREWRNDEGQGEKRRLGDTVRALEPPKTEALDGREKGKGTPRSKGRRDQRNKRDQVVRGAAESEDLDIKKPLKFREYQWTRKN